MKSTTQPSTTSLHQLFILGLLGLSLAGLTGCVVAAAGAGAGAVAYAYGELDSNLPHEYNDVVKATRAAITDLEFAKVSDNKDALKAVIIARTALDKKVEITISNSGKQLTNIKIRIGTFGDQKLSMSILDKIKANL
jgi:hypothetical protein